MSFYLHCLDFGPYLADGRKSDAEITEHTKEANESRLVTNVRWVVVSANGRIKQRKALSNVLPNSQIPFACHYIRRVGSLCNAFRPSLVTSFVAE